MKSAGHQRRKENEQKNKFTMKKNEDIFKISKSRAFQAMLLSGGMVVVFLALFILFAALPGWNFGIVLLLCVCGFFILVFLREFRIASKLYQNPEKGITINDEGIKIDIDDFRFVRWAEITDLQIHSVPGYGSEIRISTEETENPLDSSRFRQFMLNISDFAAPKNTIRIGDGGLDCEFRTLVKAVKGRFQLYKSSQPKSVRKKAKPKEREATQEEIDKEIKKIYMRILMVVGAVVLFVFIYMVVAIFILA